MSNYCFKDLNTVDCLPAILRIIRTKVNSFTKTHLLFLHISKTDILNDRFVIMAQNIEPAAAQLEQKQNKKQSSVFNIQNLHQPAASSIMFNILL